MIFSPEVVEVVDLGDEPEEPSIIHDDRHPLSFEEGEELRWMRARR